MEKLITINYEEYLELEKYKKIFEGLKYGFQEGTRNELTDEWTWYMEGKTDLFNLIAEASMCPDDYRYTRILIGK